MAQPLLTQILDETNQSAKLRKPLIRKLERHFGGKCVLVFYTSFRYPVVIDDQDADLIQSIIQQCDRSKGVVLVLSSPGGSGLAAERIVNVLRTYCPTGFEVAIPRAAKSAATMVAFGATKLHMSATSELGPIDPQIVQRQGDAQQVMPAYVIIDAYKELMAEANQTKGNLEPFLQQLRRYDPALIKDLEREMDLSEKIAVKLLTSGMMNGKPATDVKQEIKVFLDPKETASHGRPILVDEARSCGLTIEDLSLNGELWRDLWSLHVRADYSLKTNALKLIETTTHEFVAPVQ